MNRIIITAIGIDKPGLVDQISSIINDNDGNIENSKMVKIENQFAMIIDFYCSKNLDTIKTKLGNIEGLEITYKPVQMSKEYNKINQYLISGADNQGIIKKVSSFLSKNNINIIELNTFVQLAPITGSPLFNMEITISYNDNHNIDKIYSKLSKLCENLNLDIKIL
tara:strand:- start:597 stop:1094 length:498 start_codon:yes stop_codon:yes gene_type:complete